MILVSEKQSVLFCQCFWGGKANLSVKNVILTWGSLQVLHTWELFALFIITLTLSFHCALALWICIAVVSFFLIHQNTFHPRVIRSFTQQPLWVDFTCYHIPHWTGNKLSAAPNDMCAVANHRLSCVQRTTVRAELLKHWYARALMLN